MRKLTALFVMLAVVSVCSPSYGYLLVYKMKFKVKCVDGTESATISLKAYAVMDFNSSPPTLVDVNMIIYGKNPDLIKVYTVLNDNDSNDFLDMSSDIKSDNLLLSIDTAAPFDFEGLILGKRKAKDIGTAQEANVARSLKGVVTIWSGILLDDSQEIMGTATVSASLWSRPTSLANEESWSKDYLVGVLRTILEDKDYQAFVPTP